VSYLARWEEGAKGGGHGGVLGAAGGRWNQAGSGGIWPVGGGGGEKWCEGEGGMGERGVRVCGLGYVV
jgi:hypothetical protein